MSPNILPLLLTPELRRDVGGRDMVDELNGIFDEIWKSGLGDQLIQSDLNSRSLQLNNMTDQVEMHVLKKYQLKQKLGAGAYGHVWKVKDRRTKETLALKKIFDAFQHATDAKRTYREITILRLMKHPNVIKLKEVLRAQNDKDLYLLFDYMECDLHYAIKQDKLTVDHQKFIAYQLLKGLKYVHSAKLIHRDLKPSNLLLNSSCELKLCDFGLARSLAYSTCPEELIITEEVATRWYRAPEVLLGSKKYSYEADLWSVGCIIAEMVLGKPLFPGKSTLQQLQLILSFLGFPSKEDVEAICAPNSLTLIASIKEAARPKLSKQLLMKVNSDAANLVLGLLQFNPAKRTTLDMALAHRFVSDFRVQKDQVVSSQPIVPAKQNFSMTMREYRALIYEDIRKYYRTEEDKSADKRKAESALFDRILNNSFKHDSSRQPSSSKQKTTTTDGKQVQTMYPRSNSIDSKSYVYNTSYKHQDKRHSSSLLKSKSGSFYGEEKLLGRSVAGTGPKEKPRSNQTHVLSRNRVSKSQSKMKSHWQSYIEMLSSSVTKFK